MTGNSKRMQEIVKKVLDEYQLKYRAGDFVGFDKSFIRVIMGV